MKTRKRPKRHSLSLEEEERLTKTLLKIGALCDIDHNYDWRTNEKRVYDAKRALIELRQMARHLISTGLVPRRLRRIGKNPRFDTPLLAAG